MSSLSAHLLDNHGHAGAEPGQGCGANPGTDPQPGGPAALKETHKDLQEQVARDDLQVRLVRIYNFITIHFLNCLIL